jgi:hypothetical protein
MSAVGNCYQAMASEDLTGHVRVCVCARACVRERENSKLQSVVMHCIKESNKSNHQSKTHL